MTLEDTEPIPPNCLEIGDKLCILPPNKMNLITDEYYEMNHGKYSMYYYIERVPPNIIHNEKEMIIIHWIPKSREDELIPR
jgi:hypothetical protein